MALDEMLAGLAGSGRSLFVLGATSESHVVSTPPGRLPIVLGATSESYIVSAPPGRPLCSRCDQ